MRTDLLRTLATNFGSNSALAAKAIREMYQSDPVGFPPAVAEVLRSGPELPGAQFLMAILVGEADWLRTVCNPDKYSLDQSLDMVRRAKKLDPLSEMKLAKMLGSLNFASAEDTRLASRIFAVLEQVSDPSTALPALRQLSQSQNPNVRSKAALLIGRINRNPQWAAQSESETDPRVTANAVESLWGLQTRAARDAFFNAALNDHHRIAANGIVGLYMMGDDASIPFLFHLSASEKPLSRSAAAWAMGYLGDPRFLPRLTRLMADPDEMTRKGAIKSVDRVKQKMAQMRALGSVCVKLRQVECRGESHSICAVLTKDDKPVGGLDLRQFIIWNGADVVEEFVAELTKGPVPQYQIAYEGPPSPTHLVKVQVYSDLGVGEDTGFEMAMA